MFGVGLQYHLNESTLHYRGFGGQRALSAAHNPAAHVDSRTFQKDKYLLSLGVSSATLDEGPFLCLCVLLNV